MTLAAVAEELDNLAQTYAESGAFPAVTFADHVREQAATVRAAARELRDCRALLADLWRTIEMEHEAPLAFRNAEDSDFMTGTWHRVRGEVAAHPVEGGQDAGL